jgi:hypothetical protein
MGSRRPTAFAAFCVSAVLASALSVLPARAATFEVMQPRGGGPAQIVLRGKIDINDSIRFSRLMTRLRHERRQVGVLALNSPGGYVRESLAIAAVVRETKLDTYVHSLCASSCFNVFAAGATRLASREASIGVHMAFTPAGTSRVGTEAMVSYARVCGTPQQVIDKMMATPAPDMAWLSFADIRAMNVQVMP